MLSRWITPISRLFEAPKLHAIWKILDDYRVPRVRDYFPITYLHMLYIQKVATSRVYSSVAWDMLDDFLDSVLVCVPGMLQVAQ